MIVQVYIKNTYMKAMEARCILLAKMFIAVQLKKPKTNQNRGDTEEVINFGCFLIEVGPWERNGVIPSFRIKPSCAAVFTKLNRVIQIYFSSEKFSVI